MVLGCGVRYAIFVRVLLIKLEPIFEGKREI